MVSILIGENILLRSLETSDAEQLFSAVNKHRSHLRPWLPWVDATTKPEHSLEFIQQSIARQSKQEGLALGIFFNKELIGGMGMHDWNHYLKKAQLGYWITKEHEGKGIVKACLEHFIDFLFLKVGLNKVEIQFMPENKRSAILAERTGFKTEGIIRDNYLLNGNYKDLVVTGLLKSEWTPLPQAHPSQPFKAS